MPPNLKNVGLIQAEDKSGRSTGSLSFPLTTHFPFLAQLLNSSLVEDNPL